MNIARLDARTWRRRVTDCPAAPFSMRSLPDCMPPRRARDETAPRSKGVRPSVTGFEDARKVLGLLCGDE